MEERKTITIKGMEVTAFSVDRKFFNENGIKSKYYLCYADDTKLPEKILNVINGTMNRLVFKPSVHSLYCKIVTFNDVTKTFTVMKIVGENLVGTEEGLTYEQMLMELGYEFPIKEAFIDDLHEHEFIKNNVSLCSSVNLKIDAYTDLVIRKTLVFDEKNNYFKPAVIVYGRFRGVDIYWTEGEENYKVNCGANPDDKLAKVLAKLLKGRIIILNKE